MDDSKRISGSAGQFQDLKKRTRKPSVRLLDLGLRSKAPMALKTANEGEHNSLKSAVKELCESDIHCAAFELPREAWLLSSVSKKSYKGKPGKGKVKGVKNGQSNHLVASHSEPGVDSLLGSMGGRRTEKKEPQVDIGEDVALPLHNLAPGKAVGGEGKVYLAAGTKELDGSVDGEVEGETDVGRSMEAEAPSALAGLEESDTPRQESFLVSDKMGVMQSGTAEKQEERTEYTFSPQETTQKSLQEPHESVTSKTHDVLTSAESLECVQQQAGSEKDSKQENRLEMAAPMAEGPKMSRRSIAKKSSWIVKQSRAQQANDKRKPHAAASVGLEGAPKAPEPEISVIVVEAQPLPPPEVLEKNPAVQQPKAAVKAKVAAKRKVPDAPARKLLARRPAVTEERVLRSGRKGTPVVDRRKTLDVSLGKNSKTKNGRKISRDSPSTMVQNRRENGDPGSEPSRGVSPKVPRLAKKNSRASAARGSRKRSRKSVMAEANEEKAENETIPSADAANLPIDASEVPSQSAPMQILWTESRLPPPLDLKEWLDDLGLGKYQSVFEKNEVDEGVLPFLTMGDLKEMGILAVGARRKLYTAIVEMSSFLSKE